MDSCKDCKYFKKNWLAVHESVPEEKRWYNDICRRYSPGRTGVWIDVNPDTDWCGEFERK